MIVTPEGRRFSPKELDSWALRYDEYHALKRMYELDYVPVRSNVVTALPFRGGHRVKAIQSDTSPKRKRKPTVRHKLNELKLSSKEPYYRAQSNVSVRLRGSI
ncbi:phage protein [Photobacterium sagamiensis]